LKRTSLFIGIGALAILTGYLYTIQPEDIDKAYISGGKEGPALVRELIGFGIDLQQQDTFSGAFLASQFAQREHQWSDAVRYMDILQDLHPDQVDLMKRSLVLDMGANQAESAIQAADYLITSGQLDDTTQMLATLFAITGAFKDHDYARAKTLIQTIPDGRLSDFITPLLSGWAAAAQDDFNIQRLGGNALHIMHGVYMADFLNRSDNTAPLLRELTQTQDLALNDIERLGDLYLHIGNIEAALNLYQDYLRIKPSEDRVADKAAILGSHKGDVPPSLLLYTTITSPAQGLARAYYDMAYILTQDYADDSALIFANMALYLDADLTEAHLLLADLAARSGQMRRATDHYSAVLQGSPYYNEARRSAADVYEDTDLPDRAIRILNDLYKDTGSVSALIQIGNIHRRQDDFRAAIRTYNKAEDHLGGTINEAYWHLHYVRGMAYEQNKQWELAYTDLKAALAYRPNHPYLLNYLGYALADRGLELDRALSMIKNALLQQPRDGFITDSLGWVYYRLGRYEEAVPYLEKAVALEPADAIINDHLGDAYWKVGRKLEARFQWNRAQGNTDDPELLSRIADKITNGLTHDRLIQSAHNNPSGDSANAF